MKTKVRLECKFEPGLMICVDRIAESLEITRTEAVRRALRTYVMSIENPRVVAQRSETSP